MRQTLYLDDLQACQRAVDLLKYGISLCPAGLDFFPYICRAFCTQNFASIRFSDVCDVLGMIVVKINERADDHPPMNGISLLTTSTIHRIRRITSIMCA